MRIENLLLALYRSTEYFSLARTFRTAWGDDSQTSMSLMSRFAPVLFGKLEDNGGGGERVTKKSFVPPPPDFLTPAD